MSDLLLISDIIKPIISTKVLEAANETCRKAKDMYARIDALLTYQNESQYVIGKMIDEMLEIEIAVKKEVVHVMSIDSEWVAKMSKQDPTRFAFDHESIEKMIQTMRVSIERSLNAISSHDAQIDALNYKYDVLMNHLQPPVSD